MKAIYIFIAVGLLTGCNPIPIHRACTTPKFQVNPPSDVISYYGTQGYAYSISCAERVPENFSIFLSDTVRIEVRVRQTAIYLRAYENDQAAELSGPGISKGAPDGYTHFGRVGKFKDNKLRVTIADQPPVELDYSFVACTCVEFDAV